MADTYQGGIDMRKPTTSSVIDAISDPDHIWAVQQMDLFNGTLNEAMDVADDLLANWTEERNVSRFWEGKSLTDVLRERYPETSQRRAQQVISAAVTKQALPELTDGMSERALREVPVTEQTNRKGQANHGSSGTKVVPAKVKEVAAVLTEARKVSGGKAPTSKQVRVAKTATVKKPTPMRDDWAVLLDALSKAHAVIGQATKALTDTDAIVFAQQAANTLWGLVQDAERSVKSQPSSVPVPKSEQRTVKAVARRKAVA